MTYRKIVREDVFFPENAENRQNRGFWGGRDGGQHIFILFVFNDWNFGDPPGKSLSWDFFPKDISQNSAFRNYKKYNPCDIFLKCFYEVVKWQITWFTTEASHIDTEIIVTKR